MDGSSFLAVGDQLEEFLSKQFNPPDGAKTVLGFFGSGIAVEPASFIGDDGKYNPARVGTWLNISLDLINEVDAGRVGAPVFSATQLMQAVATSAKSIAATTSDVAHVLARMLDQVGEDLGGSTNIQAAPLDWYDPAGVPHWPSYTMNVGAGTPHPPPQPPLGVVEGPGLPPRPPLWTWRTMPQMHPASFIPGAVHATPLPPHPVLAMAAHPVFTAPLAHPVPPAPPHLTPGGVRLPLPVLSHVAAPAVLHATPISPIHVISRTVQPAHPLSGPALASGSLAFATAIKVAAEQAAVTAVDAHAMTVELKYTFVNLSRAPWWSDLLLGLENWYIPGQRRASWVGAGSQGQSYGVPVALILTSDVKITAAWSQADRAAAAASSHVGPWSLTGSAIPPGDANGAATLLIPTMQAVACIYRVLPPLPPQDDPALVLPVSAGAANGSVTVGASSAGPLPVQATTGAAASSSDGVAASGPTAAAPSSAATAQTAQAGPLPASASSSSQNVPAGVAASATAAPASGTAPGTTGASPIPASVAAPSGASQPASANSSGTAESASQAAAAGAAPPASPSGAPIVAAIPAS